MIKPSLALLPSLLILLVSLGTPDRDQVETRWEDSPPGERVTSAVEEVRPPPEEVVSVEPVVAEPAIEAPAPTIVVAAAVVYSPPIPKPIAPEQIASMVSLYFAAPETALRVMRCESGFNPLAVGSFGERGLMQIHPVHAHYNPATGTSLIGSLGYTWDDMFSPGPNLAVAAALVRQSGWRPWACA